MSSGSAMKEADLKGDYRGHIRAALRKCMLSPPRTCASLHTLMPQACNLPARLPPLTRDLLEGSARPAASRAPGARRHRQAAPDCMGPKEVVPGIERLCVVRTTVQ